MAKKKKRDFNWLNYKDLKKIVLKNNIKTQYEYRKFYKKYNIKNNIQIPSVPQFIYKEWKGWKQFLGTERIYYTYEEAKKRLSKFNFKSISEYYRFWKKIKDSKYPSNPHVVYKREGTWQSWTKFLSKDSKRIIAFTPFSVAQSLIIKEKVYTPNQYQKLRRKLKNFNLPSEPYKIYDKWKSWEDFLVKKYVSFEQAKLWACKQNFKSVKDYQRSKKPEGIPVKAERVYKSKWIGWFDYLGKKEKEIFDYLTTKKILKKYKLQTSKDFFKFIKKSKFNTQISRSPENYFRRTGEWKGWADFLGKK